MRGVVKMHYHSSLACWPPPMNHHIIIFYIFQSKYTMLIITKISKKFVLSFLHIFVTYLCFSCYHQLLPHQLPSSSSLPTRDITAMHWLISHWRVFPLRKIYKTFYTKHLFPEWSVIFHSSSGQGVQSICAYHPPAHRSPIFSALFLLLSPWIPCSFLLSNDVLPRQNCPSLLEVVLLAI